MCFSDLLLWPTDAWWGEMWCLLLLVLLCPCEFYGRSSKWPKGIILVSFRTLHRVTSEVSSEQKAPFLKCLGLVLEVSKHFWILTVGFTLPLNLKELGTCTPPQMVIVQQIGKWDCYRSCGVGGWLVCFWSICPSCKVTAKFSVFKGKFQNVSMDRIKYSLNRKYAL